VFIRAHARTYRNTRVSAKHPTFVGDRPNVLSISRDRHVPYVRVRAYAIRAAAPLPRDNLTGNVSVHVNATRETKRGVGYAATDDREITRDEHTTTTIRTKTRAIEKSR